MGDPFTLTMFLSGAEAKLHPWPFSLKIIYAPMKLTDGHSKLCKRLFDTCSIKGALLRRSATEGEEARQPEGEQCASRGLGNLFNCEEIR